MTSRRRLRPTGRGTWVAVWDSFDSLDGSTGTDGDILVTHSTDGYTWSEPRCARTERRQRRGGRRLPAGRDRRAGGRGSRVWHSFDALGGTIGTDGDILVSRSTDGGVTWSAAAALDSERRQRRGRRSCSHKSRPTGRGRGVAAWDSDDALGGPIGTDDSCDDCAIGTDGFGTQSDSLPGNDGTDTDSDGQCDAGDTDDDNDGVEDGSDPLRRWIRTSAVIQRRRHVRRLCDRHGRLRYR